MHTHNAYVTLTYSTPQDLSLRCVEVCMCMYASINILRVLTMHPLMDSTFQDLSPATVCPFDVAGDRCWDSAQHLRTPYMPLLPPKPLHTSTTSEPLTYLYHLRTPYIPLPPPSPFNTATTSMGVSSTPTKPSHTTSKPLTYLYHLRTPYIPLPPPNPLHTSSTSKPF